MMTNNSKYFYLCDGNGCNTRTNCFLNKENEFETLCVCKHTSNYEHAINKGKNMAFCVSEENGRLHIGKRRKAMMNRFYNFVKTDTDAELYITGDIASDDMAEFYEIFGENCTCPNGFKQSLDELDGSPLTVYIDSYGGDVIAASAIYTMLREYKGQVTVKIDSIAASAASVIAMAGDTVLMSRTAQLMIHDPSTEVWGNQTRT